MKLWGVVSQFQVYEGDILSLSVTATLRNANLSDHLDCSSYQILNIYSLFKVTSQMRRAVTQSFAVLSEEIIKKLNNSTS